jgi:hypothetical protein
MALFIESCSVINFRRKLDTLVPDHRADDDRMHSASPHSPNQSVAEVMLATNLDSDSFRGGM